MKWIMLTVIVVALTVAGCVSEKPSLPSSTSINTTILKINDTYTLYIIFTLPNPCHKVSYKNIKKVIFNEVLAGFLNGLLNGFFCWYCCFII